MPRAIIAGQFLAVIWAPGAKMCFVNFTRLGTMKLGGISVGFIPVPLALPLSFPRNFGKAENRIARRTHRRERLEDRQAHRANLT